MKNIRFLKVLFLAAAVGFNSCGNWLDVVPEGVATIDMAFNSREQALKYLATCYGHMSTVADGGNIAFNPGMVGCDELTLIPSVVAANLDPNTWRFIATDFWGLSTGLQNAAAPIMDWSWGNLYQALRNCNIFLDEVGKVPDVDAWERNQWIAEVKVLKAYYHFGLVQKYGPVPIARKLIPVDADVATVKSIVREPVDDCFQYMVELIDEAVENEALWMEVYDPESQMGRITKPIALALKAKILVTAASDLFNGNSDQATLKNPDGTRLFNPVRSDDKWKKAMTACQEAIKTCERANIRLHKSSNIVGSNTLTETMTTQLSLRNAFTERWNSEIIWANPQALCRGGWAGMQGYATPILNPTHRQNNQVIRYLSVPLKMVQMFYTNHGVPVTEDKFREAGELFQLRTATADEKLYVKTGHVTVDLNFDREPRFYAYMGFDGGIWYGQGRTNEQEELWWLDARNGGVDQQGNYNNGYIPKKHIPYTNTITGITSSSISYTSYPWPVMRLSDLYLLYAEAINEVEGPDKEHSADLFSYIDAVRERAGLKGVKYSWDTYTYSAKYATQDGMREIIRRERAIELAFEGHRFWDLRRWKTAVNELNDTLIQGWDGNEVDAARYYTVKTYFSLKFGSRDYFWPISNADILNNKNLVQNTGW